MNDFTSWTNRGLQAVMNPDVWLDVNCVTTVIEAVFWIGSPPPERGSVVVEGRSGIMPSDGVDA
jgi:hypothetical protein